MERGYSILVVVILVVKIDYLFLDNLYFREDRDE